MLQLKDAPFIFVGAPNPIKSARGRLLRRRPKCRWLSYDRGGKTFSHEDWLLAMSVSTLRTNPLTEGKISAVLGRMGLLAPGDELVCVPLEGGISSDIWRVEIGARSPWR